MDQLATQASSFISHDSYNALKLFSFDLKLPIPSKYVKRSTDEILRAI